MSSLKEDLQLLEDQMLVKVKMQSEAIINHIMTEGCGTVFYINVDQHIFELDVYHTAVLNEVLQMLDNIKAL